MAKGFITFDDEEPSPKPNESKRAFARAAAQAYNKRAGNPKGFQESFGDFYRPIGTIPPISGGFSPINTAGVPVTQQGGVYSVAKAQRLQMDKEYVVGGPYFFGTAIRTLGLGIDDVSKDLGPSVYDEMLQDPDAAAAYWFLVYSILADQLTLYPAVRDEDDPDYEKSVEIMDFCEYCIAQLTAPFNETMEEMLEGMIYGHKIGEIIYRMDSYDGKTAVLLDRIKPKPRNTLAFVVDAFLNVLGLLPTRTISGVSTGSMTAAYSSIPDPRFILPREKFMIFSVRRKDSDPRGRSIFRPAYNAWNFKRQLWPEYMLYLLNCAVPSQIGITSPDAKDEYKRDANGNILLDAFNNPLYLTPEEAMAAALSQMRNSFAAAFPHGSDVKSLETKHSGEVFEKAFNLVGTEITKAVLFQTLATREGMHQTRASSQTQMTVVDILIWSLKGALCDAIKSDVFRPLIRANYGEEAARDFMPRTTLGDTERRDWSKDADSAAKLAPYLTQSQWRNVTEVLGIPDPENDEEQLIGTAQIVKTEPILDESGNPVKPPVVTGRNQGQQQGNTGGGQPKQMQKSPSRKSRVKAK